MYETSGGGTAVICTDAMMYEERFVKSAGKRRKGMIDAAHDG